MHVFLSKQIYSSSLEKLLACFEVQQPKQTSQKTCTRKVAKGNLSQEIAFVISGLDCGFSVVKHRKPLLQTEIKVTTTGIETFSQKMFWYMEGRTCSMAPGTQTDSLLFPAACSYPHSDQIKWSNLITDQIPYQLWAWKGCLISHKPHTGVSVRAIQFSLWRRQICGWTHTIPLIS